jgi:clorobiocin biosynthesis protein CloN5
MIETDVAPRLLAFISEQFLSGDERGELDESTPLLEWGILDSLRTVLLQSFVQTEFDVVIPFEEINARRLHSVRTVAELVCVLAGTAAAEGESDD